MRFRISDFGFRISQPLPPGLENSLGTGFRCHDHNPNVRHFETDRHDLSKETISSPVQLTRRNLDSAPRGSIFGQRPGPVQAMQDCSGIDQGMNPARRWWTGKKSEIRNPKSEIGSLPCA